MNKPTYYILRGVLSLMAAVILLTGCQETPQYTATPRYVDYYNPQFVALQHGKGDNSKAPDLVIDHLNKLIYNPVPYSLGTKLDSAYLRMHLSSQLEVTLTNELTGRATRWTPSDTGKIDISGGKLRLDISSSGSDTPLSYKIRLQIYGYDPNKLTWKRSEVGLPEPSAAGKVIHFGEHDYWLTQPNPEGTTSLYRIIDIREGKFEKMTVSLPNNLILSTLTIDNRGAIWVLNNEGAAFVSLDLQVWRPIIHEGVRFTALLYDITPIGAETTLAAIGQDTTDDRYYTYTLSAEKAERRHLVDEGMPVRDTYVHTYLRAGVIVANLIGGTDATGAVTTAGYFTSNGIKWGRIPYTNKSFIAPKSGALYLNNEGVLHLIGGVMSDGKPLPKMYRSTNRGVSWIELSKSEEPGSDFTPRHGLSGLLRKESGEETYYLFGGVVNGTPSTELWRGYLDKSGGIINAYDKN